MGSPDRVEWSFSNSDLFESFRDENRICDYEETNVAEDLIYIIYAFGTRNINAIYRHYTDFIAYSVFCNTCTYIKSHPYSAYSESGGTPKGRNDRCTHPHPMDKLLKI